MEKRQLRVSGHKDYVAVDIIDESGRITSTPFYLYIGQTKEILYKEQAFTSRDRPKTFRTKVRISDDFKELLCECNDDYFPKWESPFSELTESHIKFLTT